MKNTLKKDIEARFGRSILYAAECEELSDHIFDCTETRISAQTLRRIFGFIKSNVKQSKRTLNSISAYCGYKDYSELVQKNKSPDIFNDTTITQIIKKFYEIDFTQPDDYSYHNAAGNFAKLILKNRIINSDLKSFLSKNSIAQIYFFERYPYIDGVSTSYKNSIKLYLQEKKDNSSQLFGYCLLHLGAILSLDIHESNLLLKKINTIGINTETHPFLKARFMMANLLNAYMTKNKSEQESITNKVFEVEKHEKRGKEVGVVFPYYQYIMADAFNLIEDFESSNRMIKISELDYNRIAEGKIASGYYEALDLIKAINLVAFKKFEDSKRILSRIRANDIIFIQHDYFLIQRLIVELAIGSNKSKKKIKAKVVALIKQTNFIFFKNRLNLIS